MSDKKRIFNNITEQVFNCLKKALAEHKVEIPESHAGTFYAKAKGFSFTFQYNWDEEDKLEITCVKKSFVVPYKKIWKIIEKGIIECVE